MTKEYWTKVDDTAKELVESKNYDELFNYAKDKVRIFLDENIEELVLAGKSKDAYDLLCSKYTKEQIKIMKKNKKQTKETGYFNHMDSIVIRLGKPLLNKREGSLSGYEILKKNILQSPEKLKQQVFIEIGRLLAQEYGEDFESQK